MVIRQGDKERHIGWLYRIDNTLHMDENGNCYDPYIGVTTNEPSRRFYEHAHTSSTPFDKYMSENGDERFFYVILDTVVEDSHEELVRRLNELEKAHIEENGVWNSRKGGYGRVDYAPYKKKIRHCGERLP